ncbi:reverse transcriptase domain-containing protein [Tanacetum coccineum]|uniref:Reverse transcriptase domain-containing protein n=1 Tax=Tanacetum coccineum TaxID=301880 RepID=A0ABQ5H5E1_9ASTR
MEVEEELPKPWILFTDGSSCTDGSGAGLILTNLKGMEFTYALRFRFDATNNEAEYEALIAGLRIPEQMGNTYMQLQGVLNQTSPSPWPFYKWGIDIAGPFPEGPEKVKILIVVVDYFTKWIEEKPVATITGNQIKKFVWDNIVCRFGLPREIISDNGKQFRDNPFNDWCEKLCIRQHFAFAHHTITKSSNGDTLFSLTYGTEVVIPAEIGMPTLRIGEVELAQNNEALGSNLYLLEEQREEAATRKAKSKLKIEKYYNSKV